MTKPDPDFRRVICDACNGDGGFSEPYFAVDHSVQENVTECRHCDGAGWITSEPAGPEHLANQ